MKQSILPIVSNEAGTSVETSRGRRLSRRQALQALFSGMGAALSIPALAAAHPVHRHLANLASIEEADEKAAAPDWKPEFLSAAQNQALIAIAERMVPGSTQAQVNRIIDLLLSIDTAANQRNFVASLSTLDQEANHKYGKPFPLLAPQQQDEVLTICAAGKESNSKAASSDPDEPEPAKIPVTLRDHFENLKGWIVGAYYSTETGMRELGWTEDFYFEELPGCQHGEEHAPDVTEEQEPRKEQRARLSQDER